MRKLFSQSLAVFKIVWQYALTNRLRIVFWLGIDLIIPIALGLLFKVVYASPQATIAGFDYHQLLQYYLLTIPVKVFVVSYPSEETAEWIWDGYLSKHLVRPIAFPIRLSVGSLAWRIFSFLLVCLPVLIFASIFHLRLLPSSFLSSLLLVFTLLLNFVVFWIFDFTFGLTAFWFTDIAGIQELKGILFSLLAGRFVPPQFLPDWLQSLNRWLPFQYFLAFPIQLIQQPPPPSEIIFSLKIIFIYLFIFIFLAHLLWRRGLKHYSAPGL